RSRPGTGRAGRVHPKRSVAAVGAYDERRPHAGDRSGGPHPLGAAVRAVGRPVRRRPARGDLLRQARRVTVRSATSRAGSTTNGPAYWFERGLCPRNLLWGEARKGGVAPLRVR